MKDLNKNFVLIASIVGFVIIAVLYFYVFNPEKTEQKRMEEYAKQMAQQTQQAQTTQPSGQDLKATQPTAPDISKPKAPPGSVTGEVKSKEEAVTGKVKTKEPARQPVADEREVEKRFEGFRKIVYKDAMKKKYDYLEKKISQPQEGVGRIDPLVVLENIPIELRPPRSGPEDLGPVSEAIVAAIASRAMGDIEIRVLNIIKIGAQWEVEVIFILPGNMGYGARMGQYDAVRIPVSSGGWTVLVTAFLESVSEAECVFQLEALGITKRRSLVRNR